MQSLILACIVLAVACIPSYIVVRLLYLILAPRNRPVIWLLLLFATPSWCAIAVSDASNIQAAYATASKSMPAVGADLPGLLRLALFRIPVWVIFLAPSFPALVTLLVVYPRVTASAQGTRARFDWFRSHPRQIILLGVVAIVLGVLLRAALWWVGLL